MPSSLGSTASEQATAVAVKPAVGSSRSKKRRF